MNLKNLTGPYIFFKNKFIILIKEEATGEFKE